MKATDTWSYTHYRPFHEKAVLRAPYICRIAPFCGGFEFDFSDSAESASYKLFLRKKDSDESITLDLTPFSGRVDGLDDDTDYCFRVERDDGTSSSERIVRTGEVPGIVVNYLHPDDPEYAFSGRYLCSPSLLRLENGDLLASMDLYASGAPQNLTLIYISHDDGATWSHHSEVFPCFWGKMFLCGGKLYMLGCSTEYGDVLIGRSDDNGKTWSKPTVILRGGCHPRQVGWHRAPMPVLIHGGRIMTDVQYGAWSEKVFCDAVLSAPAQSDLLCADNWVCTELFDAHEHISPLPEKIWGGIEGNMVLTPEGNVIDFLRFSDRTALILNYDPANPEKEPELDKVIDFPATASKFNIVFDDVSKKYYAIVSYALDEPLTKRNLLSLICSEDLHEWKLCRHLIDRRDDDPKLVGFQYVDFFIESDDILYLCRTAVNGANTFHNSNFSTFHRIKNFRKEEEK
ncbi:MAG: exo-alpha-sialidase [Clostridia bacterium]|nr:exo-alpha-sialidase [Clostridia bacterium]